MGLPISISVIKTILYRPVQRLISKVLLNLGKLGHMVVLVLVLEHSIQIFIVAAQDDLNTIYCNFFDDSH